MKNLRELFRSYYIPCKLSFTEKKDIFTYLNILAEETKDNLFHLIMKHISGSDISIQNLQDEMTQLTIEYHQEKEFDKNYYNFLSFLRDYTREDSSYTQKKYKNFTYKNDWKKVIELYAQWQNVNDTDYSLFSIGGLSSREEMIGKVSNEFKKYKFEIENGKFVLAKYKLQNIQNDIEALIKKIGAEFCLNYLFEKLNFKYNQNLQRYLLPKQFTNFKDEPSLEIPYNFLINLSLKHLKGKAKTKYKNQNYLDKLFNLASRYIFLYDLQDFEHMNKNSFPQHWTMKTLHQNILYDNVFRFKQMSIENIHSILGGLFDDYEEFEKKLLFSLNDYLDLISKLYSNPKHSMVKFPLEIFSTKEQQILNMISHSTNEINQDYNFIDDTTKINFLFKPLIKYDDSYLLVDKNYCAWNFYETILKNLCYPDIGISLENLIYDKLYKQQYTLYRGKYQNTQKEDGECDIVIETKEKIIFIEVKKKAITAKALEGDEVKVAEDIVDSFIHSQEQILKHEYSIKTDGQITFENGDILKLQGRDIGKISISLFDNYMLNDKIMALNIFEFFQKMRFSNPTKDLAKKNVKIENVIKKLNLLYKDNPTEYRNNRYDVYFLSLELFLYYLQINKPIDDVLQYIRQVTFSTGDLYYEYIELMKIKNYKR